MLQLNAPLLTLSSPSPHPLLTFSFQTWKRTCGSPMVPWRCRIGAWWWKRKCDFLCASFEEFINLIDTKRLSPPTPPPFLSSPLMTNVDKQASGKHFVSLSLPVMWFVSFGQTGWDAPLPQCASVLNMCLCFSGIKVYRRGGGTESMEQHPERRCRNIWTSLMNL